MLVVDDDPLSLDGLGGILRSWGCHVISAAEPHTARCALTASAVTPNLIISGPSSRRGLVGFWSSSMTFEPMPGP